MNPFRGLLAFEKKSHLLKFLNFVLMSVVLFIILIVLGSGSFFYVSISNNFLFLLFLIYLFFNLMSLLIKKGFFQLAAFLIIILLLLILFKATIIFGVDFYIIDIMYPLVILISVILIDMKFAIFVYLFTSAMFLLCFFLQRNELIINDVRWKTSSSIFPNVLLVLISYAMMIFLVYFSSKEFEIKTKKLKKRQMERLLDLAPLLNLGKLTTSLVCEIRNHLSVISIVLQNAQMDKNIIKDLDLAVEAVDQIKSLSCLGFCGLSKDSELEVFNLNLEIKKVISLFKKKSNEQKIKIIFEPNIDYQLYADRMKLKRVLVSLIFNAIESYEKVESDDKHIFIKLVKKPRNLLIKVKDYGAGIKKDDLPLIFNPYFTLKDKAKHLGLSLYVSQKAMIKNYETKIRVESSFTVGSTFTLYIKNKFLLI